MKLVKKYIYGLFLAILVVSCSTPKVEIPKMVIDKEKMVSILTDLHLAEAAGTLNFTNKDTSKLIAANYNEFIFKNHNTTKVEFMKSYNYYVSHPEELNSVYDGVLMELSKMQGNLVKSNVIK